VDDLVGNENPTQNGDNPQPGLTPGAERIGALYLKVSVFERSRFRLIWVIVRIVVHNYFPMN
jgi:hypothetical protein